ncbi:VWA domain-containing protein [Marinobacter lipolyticus]|uniref:VWA domain-containing protein n=1 Tax=Marinobacter lipolyticus TaxID=209639 RepID=UPI003A8D3CED
MRWIKSVLFLVIFNLPLWTSAQTNANLELPEGADVRIIVDISGSMKDNDPDNLRQPAVRLLARMLPENAYAGLWTFGQYVNMLVPRDRVDENWRERMISRSSEINSVALRTNLGKAIEVASDDYYTDGDLTHTDFILLTDGKVDISDVEQVNQAERERILGPLLDELVAKGATFHTVALSGEADVEFLRTLATETGGSYSVAPSAEALNRAFLNALNAAVPQEQVPIEGNRFRVDSAVREFTALIFWGEGETSDTRELLLSDPEGKTARVDQPGSSMKWARESGYDLITVTDPRAGEWRLDGQLGEGSRVTVVSDLRMVVSPLPLVFSEDEPLQLQIGFFEDQVRLTDQGFLDVMEVRVTIASEDGRSGTKVLSREQPPEDGIYQDVVERLPSAGEYVIDVVADGKTFSRKFTGASRFIIPEGGTPASSEEPAPAEPIVPVQADAPDSESGSVPEPDLQPNPEEDNISTSPIDINAVEEPSPVATEREEAGTALPLWAMVAGAIVLIALIAGGLFVAVSRKRKAASELQESPGDDDVPVIEPEQREEEKATQEPGADPVTEPEADPEEDIPVADAEVEDSDEEFGLEDFDLSEFDDLPDSGEDDEEHKS